MICWISFLEIMSKAQQILGYRSDCAIGRDMFQRGPISPLEATWPM